MRLPLVLATLAGCALSHDVPPCGVMTVETSDLSPPQVELVGLALERWNDGVGQEVLRLGTQRGDILVTGQEPDDDGAYIWSVGRVVQLGWHHDSEFPLMHELGHQLGLPDDDLPTSIMNPGVSPRGLVLPEHAELLKVRLLYACGLTMEAVR